MKMRVALGHTHFFDIWGLVMIGQQIRKLIQSLPEVSAWPEMAAIFNRLDNSQNPDWEIPCLVCQAVGGSVQAGLPGAAALACLQGSILFVDDILDNDPRGEYHRLGYGPTANLAQAIQAAAFRVIETAVIDEPRQLAAIHTLAKAAIDTAYGQNLDVQNLRGEENYWKVVQAKSTPFYGACYKIGALMGEADLKTADSLYDFGVIIGEIIQLEDDLTDAFETPSNADWREGRNNLLILYASTAQHPQQERFLQLLPQTDNLAALQEAQQILITSGAVSYCMYHLISNYQAARQLLDTLNLANPQIILSMLDSYANSLIHFLELSGFAVPKELLLAQEM